MRALALLSLCLATPFLAWADAPPILGWTDVEYLLTAHPELVAAEAVEQAAAGEVTASRGVPNPEVELEVGYAWPWEEGSGRTIWGVEAGMPLPWPGVVVHRTRGATAALDEARAERQLMARGTRLRARGLFLTVAHDQAVASLWDEAVRQGEELQRLVQMRVERGEDRPVEALRVRVDLEHSRMESERATLTWHLHRAELGYWLGGVLPAEFSVDADLTEWGSVPSLADARAQVRAGYPVLVAADAHSRALESELRLARAEAVPELTLGGFYEEELDLRAAGAVIGLEIPLGSPGAGDIARARAEATRAEQDRLSAHREVDIALDEAWVCYRGALLAAERYRDGILPAASSANEMLMAAYRAGEVSLLDVLDGQRMHLQLQVEQQNALLELHLALEQIGALIGETHDAS